MKMNNPTENSDIRIKILTDSMAPEFRFLLYSLLWSIFTLNIFIYVKILSTLKSIFVSKSKSRNINDNFEEMLLVQDTE